MGNIFREERRDEHALQRGFDHPGSHGNVDGQQETNERLFGSHGFDTRSFEISGGIRRRVGTREIFTKDGLRFRGTLEKPINGGCRGRKAVQRDSLRGSGVRASQAGQERLRKRDEKARQGNGKTLRGEGKVVRENGGKKE